MKSCVPHQTDMLLGSYLFEPTCLFDETLTGLFIILFFQFFEYNRKTILLTSSFFFWCYYSVN